jgi:imidazole glycerol phosphate synthase subunit HisF
MSHAEGPARPTGPAAATWFRVFTHGGRNATELDAEAVPIPVIASGGAGEAEHVRDAFLLAGADAALLAGMVHDGATSIAALKDFLADSGIPVRRGPAGLPRP